MPRKTSNQSKHDMLVKKEALTLKQKGLDVKADLPGFKKPPTFGGFRPDIVATDGKKRIIEEIETEDSINTARDRSQQSAFKKVAQKSKNTTFRRKIAK